MNINLININKMKNYKEEYLELSSKMQDKALKNNNIDLFHQLSTLRNIMFDISKQEYTNGVEMVRNIVFKK